MELTLIERILKNTKALPQCQRKGHITTSIGDDCAEISPSQGHNILVTTDTMVEDTHFRLSYFTPHLLGRKLATVNLSDIAAMGGTPLAATLNLEVPEKLADPNSSFWSHFIQGLTGRLARYGACLVGGDTVKTKTSKLGLTLTIIGEVREGGAIFRSGARPGDLIFCSGPLGESACGQRILEKKRFPLPLPVKRRLIARHLDPKPRISLGRALAQVGVNSMIDVSDGIATDLGHIAKKSHVKAVIQEELLPISRGVRLFARSQGESPFDFVLSGGEDFELVWTVSPKKVEEMKEAVLPILRRLPFHIGHITDGEGVWLKNTSYAREVTFKGYEH